jgi:hypothetical protein
MDVYHKVLAKIYEITGGRDTVDVDLNDLLKREGFFANIQGIAEHLSSEGWVTETARRYTVRMTHWGVAEAKRTKADLPDRVQLLEKDSGRLLSSSREFVIMLEEFAAGPSKEKFETIDKRFADLGAIVERLKSNL